MQLKQPRINGCLRFQDVFLSLNFNFPTKYVIPPNVSNVNHWLSQRLKIPQKTKLGQVALVALSALITAPKIVGYLGPQSIRHVAIWTFGRLSHFLFRAQGLLLLLVSLGKISWINLNHMDVSENNGTPKSSILIGFSIVNHPHILSYNNAPYIPGDAFNATFCEKSNMTTF